MSETKRILCFAAINAVENWPAVSMFQRLLKALLLASIRKQCKIYIPTVEGK